MSERPSEEDCMVFFFKEAPGMVGISSDLWWHIGDLVFGPGPFSISLPPGRDWPRVFVRTQDFVPGLKSSRSQSGI